MIVSKKRNFLNVDECADEVIAGCPNGIEEFTHDGINTYTFTPSTTFTSCYDAYGVSWSIDFCYIEFLPNESTRQSAPYVGAWHIIWGY